MTAWLLGVGLVLALGLILFGVAEIGAILDEREDRRVLDYIRNPASISEADARLRNELARHHDEVEP